MSLLANKVVIVTGAGGGLGEGIARVAAREGASVIVADIRKDAAGQVAGALGPAARAVHCDVSSDSDLERLLDFTVKEFGRVDGLVNNAGVNFVKPCLEITPEEWDRVISVDLRATFFLSQKVCRRMLAQDPPVGSIVNISSVHNYASLPGAVPYDAAKCGMVGMSKSMAIELATAGIRINIVSPGLLNTDMWRELLKAAPDPEACLAYWMSNIPASRVIEPEEIGELVCFLLSDRASCMTGANIMADAGITSQLVSREPYVSQPIALAQPGR